ncbi:FxSxx-COOH system tetratricopeptide repeat protein [Amycolatopsis sp. NPDC058278]|uniref:FxSxx-COOH system tetratricopeptide repeat protein n=1 Tax=Amycolatopsis sp. NPDC058278 TaxID=3346417 RepID=UPI0036DC70E2
MNPAASHGTRRGRTEAPAASGLDWRDLADAVWLNVMTGGRVPEEQEQRTADALPRDSSFLSAGDRKPGERPRTAPSRAPAPGPVRPPKRIPAPEAGEGTAAALSAVPLPVQDPALIKASAVVRALRTLKRKVESRHADEVVLDEVATAERVAEDGLWLPITTPDTERWLDLTVVTDAAPSMRLWQSTVAAFRTGLEQLGAFRTIQFRRLDTRAGTGCRTRPVLHGDAPASQPRDPAALIDPTGRRLVLVLTDGAGELWRTGAVPAVLAEWAEVMPTAVVHMLPQRLWARGLEVHRARLSVPAPLTPNCRWDLELPDAWADGGQADTAHRGSVPVPVLEMGPRWLDWWARLVCGEHAGPVMARVLLGGAGADDAAPDFARRDQESAQERVRYFLSTASPPAHRLAKMLAAVPATFPVAQFVQAELVPEARSEHLAEVLYSGLLPPIGDVDDDRIADTLTFEFPVSVRQVLLSGARRSETAEVVRATSARFGDSLGAFSRIPAAVDAPDSAPDPEPGADTAGGTALERVVMQALSGPYLSRAQRISSIERHSSRQFLAEGKPRDPKSQDLAESYGELVTAMRPETPLPTEARAAEEGPQTPPAREEAPTTTRYPEPARELEYQKRPEVPAIWGNIPPRNPKFTGRQELLRQLSESMVSGASNVLPSVLHGMGGIGKTQIAVEYIYHHLSDYDIVWWIHAAHPTQIRIAFTELARKLRLPGAGEADSAVPAVREALRTGQPHGRWLLVFDSAEDPLMVRSFFPANGTGQILVTTRNPDWTRVARPIEVEVFSRSESLELLHLRGPEIDEADADQLAEKLGDLPLAIEQAAAWRAETGMPVHEYLRLFDEKVAEILNTSAPADYELPVAAAWNVAFDELRTRNAAAHQLLQVCAFFAPEPISRAVFSGVRGVTVSPELDSALRDPIQLSMAIRAINRYGLAKIDHRSDTLIVHRLVQLVLRNRMTPKWRAEMRHGAHLLLSNLDPNDPVSSKQWPRYRELLPHAYAAEIVECDDRWVRQLVLNLMSFLYQWGDHDEAVRLAELALREWRTRLGEDDPQTVQAAERLGYYYWVTGCYAEAAQINRTTLETRRRMSGDESEETLAAQIAVAGDLSAQGDFMAARDLTEEVYHKSKALFGEDDPATLRAARIHGTSLRLCGDFRASVELDEANYRRQIEVLGYDHAETLSSLMGLIIGQREAGRYEWARREHEVIAERVREMFGDDNAETLRRRAYLAVTRRKAGDHDAARQLAAEVLERFVQRYGNDNFNVMACALGYSIDLRYAGDLSQARRLGEEIFERYRRNLGESHPHTTAAAVDLAVTLRLSGDPAAKELDERSLAQLRESLGPDHPSALACGVNLASDLAAAQATEAALELGTDIVARAERVLGAGHPITLAACFNRVLDLRSVGQQGVEAAYAEVLAQYRHALGDGHPDVQAVLKGLRADCDIDPLPL